jgi:predicted TIM-barrel fold metal-dependent hydrolase
VCRAIRRDRARAASGRRRGEAHYPKAIIDYANTRGSDKILYAGYFPAGLTLERIFADMPNVPYRDNVWPKFLRENAVKLLKL